MFIVEGLKLGLALVELLVITLLDGDASVRLIHLHREFVPLALHLMVGGGGWWRGATVVKE